MATEAFEKTDALLSRAQALSYALHTLAPESECLNKPTDEAHSLWTLIILLHETIQEAVASHKPQPPAKG